MKRIDLIGKRFGRWTVIAYARNSTWSCICDCGAHVVVNGKNLRRGLTKSCGCLGNNKPKIDLLGNRFGRWTVLAYVRGGAWSCVCDCGARVVVNGHSLRTGNTKSCGCLKWELSKTRNLQHGMCRTSEYNIWASMKQRCLNPRNAAYEYYGGRGIKPCDEWLSFIPYFADTGSRPEGCSLNRIDNDGIYEPTNCSWADAKQQAHNRRPRRARKAKRRQFEPSPPPPLNDPPF